MLHALLCGKLDPTRDEPQRLEDALTSTVFGTLAMVEAWDLLAQWLERGFDSPEPGGNAECWFWPRLEGAVIPDVVLRLGQVLVVVEAKYHSGRNDLTSSESDDERPVDQIVRQHRAVSPPHEGRSRYPELLERAVRECRVIQAFVVDARRMRGSRREYAESRQLLPPGAELNLVTWQALYELLLDARWVRLRWATDVRAYLELCGLASFNGIRRRIPEAADLKAISIWNPGGRQAVVPRLRAAAATLADGAIANLRSWRVPTPSMRRGRRLQ